MKSKNFPEIAFAGKGAFSGVRAALDVLDSVKRYISAHRHSFLLVSLNGAPYGVPRRAGSAPAQYVAEEPFVIATYADGTAMTSDGLIHQLAP